MLRDCGGTRRVSRKANRNRIISKTPLPSGHAHEKLAILYGTRETAYSRTGRSKREDLQSLLLSNDRASRTRLQRPLRSNPASTPVVALHPTIGVYQHLFCLGSHGGGPPEPRFQESPQL